MEKWMRGLAVCLIALGACSEPEPPPAEQELPVQPPPLGAWIMYGGEKGLLKPDAIEEESTTLVLADSTYSLTFQRPDAKFSFVESGKVYYDLRARVARFTVLSASGVDWSSGVPRKLVLIPETVPFQRDPGTVYGMVYTIDDSLMSLAGSETETTWFVKAPH